VKEGCEEIKFSLITLFICSRPLYREVVLGLLF